MNAKQTQPPAHPLIRFRKEVEKAIPTFGLTDEKMQKRMVSVLMVAVERDPSLLVADKQSLFAAIRHCAAHGLMPDGNEAALVTYRTRAKQMDGTFRQVLKVEYQPMVRGIIKRILQSGKVHAIWAELVHEGEQFSIDISRGDRRPIHSPDYFNRSGKIIGVYAVAKLANGSVDCEPLTMEQITRIRKSAKTQKVWDEWFDEKAKVAAIRRLAKRLPLSSDDMEMVMNYGEHDFNRDEAPAEERGGSVARFLAANQGVEFAADFAGPTIDDAMIVEGNVDDGQAEV